jgi:hypothetical protein
MCRLSRNPGALTSRTTQGHVGLFRGYFTYMFRATQCSSSGVSIVSIHHLVYITVCRWLFGMQVSDIYQMMYWYNWFSWRWALGCSKHIEKWNNTLKKCVKLVINKNYTETRGQQNIKFCKCLLEMSQKVLISLRRLEASLQDAYVPETRLFCQVRWQHKQNSTPNVPSQSWMPVPSVERLRN